MLGAQWRIHGGFGVPLFFTLSGFLIGGLLLSELRKHEHISISRFLIRRGFKIYPAYFVFLAYLFLLPLSKALFAGQDLRHAFATLLGDYYPNFLFLQNYIGPNPAGHTWSLAVEEHFYIMLPFAIATLVAAHRTRWLTPVCLLSPVLFTAIRISSACLGDPYLCNLSITMGATHLCLDGLLVGVGLRSVYEFYPEAFGRLRSWRIPFLLAGPLILIAVQGRSLYGIPVERILPVSMLAATALFLGVYHTSARDFGSGSQFLRRLAKPFAHIGADSYSIYLWHVTILGIAGKILLRFHWPTNTSLAWFSSAGLISCTIFAIGILLARLVEWPTIRLRDRLFPSRS